jgi:hypothetical protein
MTPTPFFLNMVPKVVPLVLRLGLSLTYFEMSYKNIIAIFFIYYFFSISQNLYQGIVEYLCLLYIHNKYQTV